MTTTALSETPDSPAALVKRWRDEAVTHENRAKELSYGYPILADTHEKKAAQKMECANQLESALASAEPVCYASEEMLRPLREGDENSAEVILWREKGHIHNVAIYAHANAQPAAKVEALCSDCPPVGYPTDATRCTPCPRNSPTPASVPDGLTHECTCGYRWSGIINAGSDLNCPRCNPTTPEPTP